MKNLTLTLFFFFTTALFAQPQFCEPDPTTRVLMIGDSWTLKLVAYDSFSRIFNENDRADLAAKGDLTSFPGAETRDWVKPENLAIIDGELAANPGLKVVQIMLGANEMLGGYTWNGWRANMTPLEEAALRQEIAGNIGTIVDHIQSVNPQVRVLVAFYDYMGFEEVMKDPFVASLWAPVMEDLAFPTSERMNRAFVDMAETVIEVVGSREGVDFIEYWGLMQNRFGFASEGVEPGDIELPGDITRSSPAEAMGFRNWDALHLSQDGYDHVARYLWENYYADQLCITAEDFSQAVSSCAENGGNPSALIQWMHDHMCD